MDAFHLGPFSWEEQPFIFVGCEEVPGFEAVALGQKVDAAWARTST